MDEELARIVGQRIRRLRQREGISLRRQAELAGVSASALSALENGRGGMSLSALQRVADRFGLSITDLLAEPPTTIASSNGGGTPVEGFPDCASMANAVRRGTGALYQLLGSGNGHLLQPYVLSFLPGGGYGSDQIGHAGEEFAYVVVGIVELLLGEEVHRLRQGDGIRFDAEIPHSFQNASDSGMALVVGAATPPW
jgi:transcriptional regulator with XRE-family HTH domain/quercetin dioxygenase-like cupin family protein